MQLNEENNIEVKYRISTLIMEKRYGILKYS